MNENSATITNRLLLEIPKRFNGARALRRNVGMGLGMGIIHGAVGCIQRGDVRGALALLKSRPIIWGRSGESDIEGFIPINGNAVLLCVEVKAGRDTTSEQQVSFARTVTQGGAIYTVAHNSQDALADIARQVEEKRK